MTVFGFLTGGAERVVDVVPLSISRALAVQRTHSVPLGVRK